jgi:hypothetical protein
VLGERVLFSTGTALPSVPVHPPVQGPFIPAQVFTAAGVIERADVGHRANRVLRFTYEDPVTLNTTEVQYSYDAVGLLAHQTMTIINLAGELTFEETLDFKRDGSFSGTRDYRDGRGPLTVQISAVDGENGPARIDVRDASGDIQEISLRTYNDVTGSMQELLYRPRSINGQLVSAENFLGGEPSEIRSYRKSPDPANREVRTLAEDRIAVFNASGGKVAELDIKIAVEIRTSQILHLRKGGSRNGNGGGGANGGRHGGNNGLRLHRGQHGGSNTGEPSRPAHVHRGGGTITQTAGPEGSVDPFDLEALSFPGPRLHQAGEASGAIAGGPRTLDETASVRDGGAEILSGATQETATPYFLAEAVDPWDLDWAPAQDWILSAMHSTVVVPAVAACTCYVFRSFLPLPALERRESLFVPVHRLLEKKLAAVSAALQRPAAALARGRSVGWMAMLIFAVCLTTIGISLGRLGTIEAGIERTMEGSSWLQYLFNAALFLSLICFLRRIAAIVRPSAEKSMPAPLRFAVSPEADKKIVDAAAPLQVKGKIVLVTTKDGRKQLERVQYSLDGQQHQFRFRYHKKKVNPHLAGLLRQQTVTRLDVPAGTILKQTFAYAYDSAKRVTGYKEQAEKTFFGRFYRRESGMRPSRLYIRDREGNLLALAVIRFLRQNRIRLFLFRNRGEAAAEIENLLGNQRVPAAVKRIERRIDGGERSDQDVVFPAAGTVEDLYRRIFNRAVESIAGENSRALEASYRPVEKDERAFQIRLAQTGKKGEMENGDRSISVVREIGDGPQAAHQQVRIFHGRMIEAAPGETKYLSPAALVSPGGESRFAPDEERIYETPPDPWNPDASYLKETRQWFFRSDGSPEGPPLVQCYEFAREEITAGQARAREAWEEQTRCRLSGTSPLTFSDEEPPAAVPEKTAGEAAGPE